MCKVFFRAIAVLILMAAGELYAFRGSGALPPWVVEFGKEYGEIALHPYHDGVSLPHLRLYQHGFLDLADYGKLLLREWGLDPMLEIVAQPRDATRIDYRYRLQGHNICDLQAAVTQLHGGGLYQRGRYPLQPWMGHDFIWPARELAIMQAEEAFSGQVPRIAGTERCLLSTLEGFLPVYDIMVQLGQFPYRVRTDGYEVLGIQRQFYDAQGEFHVYEENPVRNARKELFLIEVKGDGRPVNAYFDTFEISDDNNKAYIYSENNVFDYADNDPQMAHASTFAHANLMMQWFKKVGFNWQDDTQIEIIVHSNYDPLRGQYNPNNAFYAPPQEAGGVKIAKPRIMIGDGDGRGLQNLALDSDVISHELSHHVIYHYLRSTGGHSGTIHEGLADYFTFAKTGNPCLGESICPRGSRMCQLEGQCLRYADHDYRWHDVARLGIHIEGQIISATLWDLRSEITADDVDRLALRAVQHLTHQSGISDLIDSLLAADHELFEGRNCNVILNALLARGLQEFISLDISCKDGNTPATLVVDKSGGEVGALRERGSNKHGCGVIFASPTASRYVLIVLLLPLLACLLQRRRYALHRHSHASDP